MRADLKGALNQLDNISDFCGAEMWHIGNELRFVNREIDISNKKLVGFKRIDKVLQQLHISSLGNRKWVDIPTETES